jgi:molybdopterin converting factor small subunit
MQITVRYFAGLREERGCDEEVLGVAAGTAVSELYQRIFSDSPLRGLRVR